MASDPADTPPLIHSLALHRASDETEHWFAASNQGLRRSSNGGQTWTDCYQSLEPQAAISTLVVTSSPGSSSTPCLLAGVIGGVLRSTDQGQAWSVFEAPPPPAVFTSLTFSPDFTQDGLVFAGSLEDGVFRSDDRGRTWAAWNFGLLDLAVLDVVACPAKPGSPDITLLAATETGVFRSTNSGRAWRETGFPSDLSPVICLAVSTQPNDPDGSAPPDSLIGSVHPDSLAGSGHTLFAGTESDGLYQSNDGGANWLRLGDPASGAVNAIMILPFSLHRQPHLLALVGDTLYLSRDSGQGWITADLDHEMPAGISSIALRHPTTPPVNPTASTQLLVGLLSGEVLTTSLRAD